MTLVTRDQLFAAIKADYEQHGGNYVYDNGDGCWYRTPVHVSTTAHGRIYPAIDHSEGAAGCWVGRVVDRLGLLPPVLYVLDSLSSEGREGPSVCEGASADRMLEILGITFWAEDIDRAMLAAQSAQDSGHPLFRVVQTFAAVADIDLDDLGFWL